MNRPVSLVPVQDESVDVRQRWIWTQNWWNLLFLHWRVPASQLRRHVSPELSIDEFDGGAWVSLVLFQLKVRPTWLPFLPGLSNLVEVNLRTYVRHQDRPGITFLSVHAHNRLAMFLARRLTPMPYRWARLSYRQEQNGYRFAGRDRAAGGFRLAGDFRVGSPSAAPGDGTVDAWLVERYRLFLPDHHGRMAAAEVNHPRWQVRDVEVALRENTSGARFGLDLPPTADRAHFSDGTHVRFGGFRKA